MFACMLQWPVALPNNSKNVIKLYSIKEKGGGGKQTSQAEKRNM